MIEYKEYFKNRKEVEDFFNDETFKFALMTDNMMHFESLNPIFLGEKLVSFQLVFYFEEGCDFFTYSGFHTWLDDHQLSSVKCKSEESGEIVEMFFAKYVDYRNN